MVKKGLKLFAFSLIFVDYGIYRGIFLEQANKQVDQ